MPKFARISGIAALAMSLCLSANPGSAQVSNYSTYLFGERAMGMGGAFTGLASDASAAFYNPAGLAFQMRSQISASISLNAITRVELEDGFRTEIGDADLIHEFNGAVPLFVGMVRKVGSEDDFGFARHALALSTVYPGAGGRRHRTRQAHLA